MKVRDVHNISAALRVGGAMKHKNTPRGGARNLQTEYLAEVQDLAGIEDEVEAEARQEVAQ